MAQVPAEDGETVARRLSHWPSVTPGGHARKCRVVKGVGEELVDERAEGHAAAPARGEVLDVHVLWGRKPRHRNGEEA